MRRWMLGSLIYAALCSTSGAATISFTALNDGTGSGVNVVTDQPAGIAATLDGGANVFDYFLEPAIANGTNSAAVSATNAGGASITIREGTFDSFALPGAPATLGLIDFSGSNIDFEASDAGTGNGTSQAGAASLAWGVDTDTSISSASNTVLAFETSSNTAGTFSAVLLDLEGGGPNGAAPAYVAVYDNAGTLTSQQSLLFPSAAFGDDAEYLFSFTGLTSSATIAFFVGDDDAAGDGHIERIAAADFGTFTSAAVVPLPATFWLLAGGLLLLGRVSGRRPRPAA